MDSINIGPTPTEESCVQVGSDAYYDWAKKETRAYRLQCLRVLEQQFKEVVCFLKVTTNSHDFGTYYDLDAQYMDAEGAEQALWLESNSPEKWDEEAREELGPKYFALWSEDDE